MAMNKKEKMDAIRNEVMELFQENLANLIQIDNGSYVAQREDENGNEVFVEVKFIVKGDAFDFEDALMAFEDKKAKAKEKVELKAKKLAELAKKQAEKDAKKAEKEKSSK